MATAITAEGLSKRYRIGELQAAYGTLRDSLSHAVEAVHRARAPRAAGDLGAPRRLVRGRGRARSSASSARNGAGKSTLLRGAHRITAPTAGRAEIRGRVGSLLEVGTGFHPELTGRENVYLNGAVLGHAPPRDRAQVRRHRRVLGCRAVPRHAGEALLERDVRAARVLRRRPPRAGDPPRRRGARGRRRRVPAALPRPDGGPRRVRPHGRLRLAQHADDHAALRPRDPARQRRGRRRRAELRGRRALPAVRARQRVAPRVWPDLGDAPGDDLVRLRSRPRRSTRRRRSPSAVDVRRPVGIEIAFTVLRDGEPDLAEDQGPRPAGRRRVQRDGHRRRAGTSRPRRATTWRPPGSPGTCSTKGSPRRSRRRHARDGRSSSTTPASATSSRSTCRTPARATRRAGRFTGQWKGVVRPLLEWTCEDR